MDTSVLVFRPPEFALPPYDDTVVGTDLDFVHKRIDDASYWGINHGGASLFFAGISNGGINQIGNKLDISFHHEHGFWISHIVYDTKAEPAYYVAINRCVKSSEPVTMDNGDEFSIPSSWFGDAEHAKNCAQEFVRTNGDGRFNDALWINMNDLTQEEFSHSYSCSETDALLATRMNG